MRHQHKSYLARLMIAAMVSEVRLMLNLTKAWFYVFFLRPRLILQRSRFSAKSVHCPMVGECWATIWDAAPALKHDWLIVHVFWPGFTPARGPLSAELHQPWMSLRHGLYVLLLPEGQYSG